MDKKEIMNHISAVMRTLDTGIEVRGVQNAGNLAGCFAILDEVAKFLNECDIIPNNQKSENNET